MSEQTVERRSESSWASTIRIVVAVLALGFGTQANHPIVSPEGRAVAIVCGVVSLVALLGPKASREAAFASGLFLCLVPRADLPWQIAALLGLSAAPLLRKRVTIEGSAAAIWAAGFFTLLLLADATGYAWGQESQLGWGLTRSFYRLIHSEGVYDLSVLGLCWPLLGFSWIVAAALRRLWGVREYALALTLLLLGFVGMLWIRDPAPAAFSVACMCAIRLRAVEPNDAPRNWRSAVAGAALVLGLVVPLALSWQSPLSSPSALIISGGLGNFGIDAGPPQARGHAVRAEFGGLARMLRTFGWKADTVPPDFDERALDGRNVVCVINPTKPFPRDRVAWIEGYVKRGGSLLVLGDHTDISGIRGPLNDLLSFTSIGYNFDSAIASVGNSEWRKALRTAVPSSLASLDNSKISISVGASLRCGFGARTLIRGEKGYSDKGDASAGISKLGDMSYSVNERLGGLPLVAEQNVGAGTVQVWGDTSGFQNNSFTENHETIVGVMNGLACTKTWLPYVVMASLLCAFGGLAGLRNRPGALTVAIGLGLAPWLAFGQRPLEDSPRPTYGMWSAFDISHAPLYPAGGPAKGTARLKELFIRQGSLLLDRNSLDAVRASSPPKAWVIVAPTRRYSREEAKTLKHYVEGGGKLVVAAGAPQAGAVAEVLREFEVAVGDEPFGRAIGVEVPSLAAATATSPEYRKDLEAHAPPYKIPDLTFVEAFGIRAPKAEILATCFGEPIVVRRRVGRGSLVFIADSRFATDHNLGEVFEYNVTPNRFLYFCLG